MKVVLVIFGVLAVSGVVFLHAKELPSNTSEAPVSENVVLTVPPGDPTPFVEMTIPFLRNREYRSSLGELKKYQTRSNYTSYLTSYVSDGLKVNGLLTIPNGNGPWPAIVFVHGYIPPSIYKTTEKYVDYVDYLARNGFVVFKIDLRGNGDSEGTPSGAYYSGGYVIDTLNAYAALASASFVDKSKIGIWGHSMAGNVTFRSFVANQNIPALVVWAGAGYSYEDLSKYRLNDQSYRPPSDRSEASSQRARLREAHGDFNKEDDFWKQVVPTHYLDGVRGAVEIHHAVDDSVVSISYSRDLVQTLNKTNIPHQLFEYESGGHNINGSSFGLAMRRTVEFFKKYLNAS